MTNIRITGTSGFIGFSIVKKLLDEGNLLIGFDNENDYYGNLDLKLKSELKISVIGLRIFI